MTKRVTPYLLLAVWTAVAAVLQALATRPLGVWAPDLQLVLLVVAVAQLHRRDAVRLALVAGLARSTFTVEPPFAVLAGTMAIALVADGVRRFAELNGALLRATLCAGASLGFGVWLLLVHAAHADRVGHRVSFAVLGEAPALLATATTTALAALLLWPLAARLPGLRAPRARVF